MKNFSIQIRRYSPEGCYKNTVKTYHYSSVMTKATIEAWLEEHTEHELKESMQTTPLNIMIRRDGKLISYKELM